MTVLLGTSRRPSVVPEARRSLDSGLAETFSESGAPQQEASGDRAVAQRGPTGGDQVATERRWNGV